MAIEYEKDLNPEQLAAVMAPDGPVLVIAAAGTGKTRTLTYRVARLVERGVEPSRILLLTFTNKAAREMLERARHLAGDEVGGLWGGTFHHMANRILRRHAEEIGYRSDYSILDQDDARTLLKAALDELDLTGKHFPKPDVLLSLFSLADSRQEPLESHAIARFGDHSIDVGDIVRVRELYQSKKRAANAMDFDDLLVNGLRLFREHPDILNRYQERFVYILVDEYQDTNAIQSAWVDLLAEKRRNLLVVGDDFQSIYSWRGADFRNILSFPKRYPETSIFKLQTNYRSVPGILGVANACIAGNPDQFQKTLRAVRPPSIRLPVLVRLRDGDQQALYVVDRIRRLRAAGRSLRDIAVLYRAHYHALELQLLLTRERIPFVITSGVRFFEQAHIKDVCAPLRLAANPSDELAFQRLLQLFPKTGQKTARKIWDALGRRFHPLDARARATVGEMLPAAAREAWSRLEDTLAAASGEPAPFLEKFVDAFYDQYAIETFDNYARRREDLDELIVFTAQFADISEFIQEMALLTNLDAEPDDPHAGRADAVCLSTIHQAKGLEWSTVFVLWLSEGMFPSHRSMGDAESYAEERRLFYVAVTRAKDDLFLCVPAVHRSRDGGENYYLPSRFVTEIPPHLVIRENYYD
ncbi:MAG: UvrD-helicase domain-containing protein [Kiritimatiellae bacterium]|nr:UvrD-helicase domain-containing protein [Kiritimatiellia bacterium]MDW8458461.1 UvrD-helicase domain-containing protein [Verrucomicrobiota bacterium]